MTTSAVTDEAKLFGKEGNMAEPHPTLGRCCSLRLAEKSSGKEFLCSGDSIYSGSPVGHHYYTSTGSVIIVKNVTLSYPSPALCCTEKAPQDAQISQVTSDDSEHGHAGTSNEVEAPKTLRDVHISARLMEDFLELAKENTQKDLETCGVLGAFLEKEIFYVTTLIVPKQEASSSSCQAVNEEDVFAIQNDKSLYTVGWIHTHPSQSCFMSSVDLHTHYSYQIMVPEAFAIVMAPTDTSRSYGIFRLCDPAGMNVLKGCQEGGFHLHNEPEDGSPIYKHCSHVYTNSNLRFEIFDLR